MIIIEVIYNYASILYNALYSSVIYCAYFLQFFQVKCYQNIYDLRHVSETVLKCFVVYQIGWQGYIMPMACFVHLILLQLFHWQFQLYCYAG